MKFRTAHYEGSCWWRRHLPSAENDPSVQLTVSQSLCVSVCRSLGDEDTEITTNTIDTTSAADTADTAAASGTLTTTTSPVAPSDDQAGTKLAGSHLFLYLSSKWFCYVVTVEWILSSNYSRLLDGLLNSKVISDFPPQMRRQLLNWLKETPLPWRQQVLTQQVWRREMCLSLRWVSDLCSLSSL